MVDTTPQMLECNSRMAFQPDELAAWRGLGSTYCALTLTAAEIAALLASTDSTLADLQGSVRVTTELNAHTRDVITLARRQCATGGGCAIDDATTVSEGDDNGAYVLAWVWVDFEGTPLAKDLCHCCGVWTAVPISLGQHESLLCNACLTLLKA